MTVTPFTNHYKHLKYRMVFGFSLAFLITTAFLAGTIVYQSNNMMTGKVLEMTNVLTNQVTVAVDSLIKTYEERMNVLFLPTGNEPADMVFKGRFSALQHSASFALVHKDGRIEGSISDASIASLGKPLYQVLNMAITSDEGTWITADDLSSGEVFYVRRFSPDSCIITSIHINQIRNLVSNSSLSEGLVIRVVASNGLVLYSTQEYETGMGIDSGELNLLNSRIDTPKIDWKQMNVITRCSNGWLVTASARTADILQERSKIVQYALIMFFIAIGFILVFCIVFSMNLTMPIDTLVRRLYNQSIRDQDTKLFLKDYFGECVKSKIEQNQAENFALIQLDIDNFKQMHDMRGNTFCNRIITELADAMQTTFPDDAILGRIGHDRFMVFTRLPGDSFQQIHQWCLTIQDSFRDRVEKTENATGISVSCGIVLVPEHGTDFDLICELSDRAVFSIKREGKNGYHIYTPGDDVNVWK